MNAIRSAATSNWVYQNLFKRNSNYFGLILVGAILAEAGVSKGIDSWWAYNNRGVRSPPLHFFHAIFRLSVQFND